MTDMSATALPVTAKPVTAPPKSQSASNADQEEHIAGAGVNGARAAMAYKYEKGIRTMAVDTMDAGEPLRKAFPQVDKVGKPIAQNVKKVEKVVEAIVSAMARAAAQGGTKEAVIAAGDKAAAKFGNSVAAMSDDLIRFSAQAAGRLDSSLAVLKVLKNSKILMSALRFLKMPLRAVPFANYLLLGNDIDEAYEVSQSDASWVKKRLFQTSAGLSGLATGASHVFVIGTAAALVLSVGSGVTGVAGDWVD